MARERWTDMDEETTVPGKAPRGIETKKGSVMASVVSRMPSLRSGLGDCLGGLAAMLVALPSAIAFGLIVYAPLGSEHAGKAAVAGVTGTIALGLVAPAFGGTSRLISAPCAPGAAVLAVFVGELVRNRSIQPETIPLYVALVALLAGLLQFVAGSLGGGKFIKYIPYPVVAGYLNGLGILILAGQLPKFFGLPKDVSLFSGLVSPEYWQWPCIAVGTATVFAMLLAPRITKTIPAAILALVAGIACYALLARAMPPLASLQGNTFVIGPIAMTGAGFVNAAAHQWAQIGQIGFDGLGLVVVPVFTLAILLSIDTLKTCVILDAMTYSRHNSNRELVGQGLGNMASALACGIPGAGTLGPTLVNVNSGAQTSLSGLFAGLSALAVLLLIGQLIAWIPLAALAGILIVVAYRMLDWSSFRLLKHHSTVFDF
ncbi:MAG TPA: SulP family inorganic anion transporter, partial [Candidatus Hydrogenedentes bacterium]|nr:SulP family inorganic anion transporter [Candidatus Hydrogenedentota bacterium]